MLRHFEFNFYAASWSDEVWIPSSGWTGSAVAALYRSFDGFHGMILMEGNQQVTSVPLVTVKER